ncbi:MAG: hypothetical protein ACRYFV_01710 [Janthinobacterium lividum]
MSFPNMKEPESLDEAAEQLAETFRLITKPACKPKVTLMGRDEKGRVVIVVGFRGNQMIAAMQVEAFIVENGDSIRHRSQVKDGNTFLIYQMEARVKK